MKSQKFVILSEVKISYPYGKKFLIILTDREGGHTSLRNSVSPVITVPDVYALNSKFLIKTIF